MPLWIGETWLCEPCGWVNAVLRKRCRNCYRPRPGEVPAAREPE